MTLPDAHYLYFPLDAAAKIPQFMNAGARADKSPMRQATTTRVHRTMLTSFQSGQRQLVSGAGYRMELRGKAIPPTRRFGDSAAAALAQMQATSWGSSRELSFIRVDAGLRTEKGHCLGSVDGECRKVGCWLHQSAGFVSCLRYVCILFIMVVCLRQVRINTAPQRQFEVPDSCNSPESPEKSWQGQ